MYKILLATTLLASFTSILLSQDLIGILPSECEKKIEYVVKSPSIRFDFPSILYWDSIQLLNDEKENFPIEIYLEGEYIYKLFDSLEYSKYTINHVSSFGDIFSYEISLSSDTLLYFPVDKLKYNSKDVEISDLSTILDVDTLQLLVTEFGCEHHLVKYYEIIKGEVSESIDIIGMENQIFLSDKDFNNKVSKMIEEAKDINYCNSYSCSDSYSLKAGDKIYAFYNCCVSSELIAELKTGTNN